MKRKKSKKKRLLIALLIIGAIIASVSLFVSRNITPMIITISNEKIKSLTYDAVSRAVLDVMSQNGDTEIMRVDRDGENMIKSVEIDSETVTRLAQQITIQAQKYINTAGQEGIKIPVGSLSGITLFTGLGPDINIKIYLTGSTQTKITSVFSESGINQSLHTLYFNIVGSVAVAVPGLPSTIKTETQALMSETIILGEVPPTYLKAVNVGDMLDLIVD